MGAKSTSRQGRPSDIQAHIRSRAYELYEQRGKADGFALDDWLQAESEILGTRKPRKARAAKASK